MGATREVTSDPAAREEGFGQGRLDKSHHSEKNEDEPSTIQKIKDGSDRYMTDTMSCTWEAEAA